MSEQTDAPAIVRGDDVEYETVDVRESEALASQPDAQSASGDAAEGLSKGVLVGEEEGAPNFAMRRFVLEAGAAVPDHTNEVEHVQYVLEGEYTVGIEGEEHVVEAGDSLYVPAGAVHRYRNDGGEASTDASGSRTESGGRAAFICVVPHGEDDIQLVE